MSEQLSTPEDLIGQRFNKFVDEYAGQALLWVVQKSSKTKLALPILDVEFETHDKRRKNKPEWDDESYVMAVQVSLPEKRQLERGTNRQISSIFIEGSANFSLDFLDEDDNLPILMYEHGKEDTQSCLEAIDTLIDELEVLESEGIFIPAGKRVFPDGVAY